MKRDKTQEDNAYTMVLSVDVITQDYHADGTTLS